MSSGLHRPSSPTSWTPILQTCIYCGARGEGLVKSLYYERYFCEDRRACARRILKVMGKQLQDTQIEFRFPDELPMKHALYGLWLRVHDRIGEFNVREGNDDTEVSTDAREAMRDAVQ